MCIRDRCKCMGSKLTVSSEEGKGSCFTFEIPVCHIFVFEDELVAESRPSHELTANTREVNSRDNLKEERAIKDAHVASKINPNVRLYFSSKPAEIQKPPEEIKQPEPAATKPSVPKSKEKYYKNFINSKNANADNCETASTPTSEMNAVVKKKVVLVTDDAFYNRMIMKEMLRKLRVQSIEANNGEEAVSIVENSFKKSNKYEIGLILMDINMPIMNGVESTMNIRQVEKNSERKERIPIVAVTAHDSAKDRACCIQAGMQEYYLKPVTSKQLESIVNTFAKELIDSTTSAA
eukprot:TRINITY_DN2460_c0_g1_i11.p1 TRINITY_DN2460_c0_g1~~TRINITY_DN2460_c0_g1_i11.p1  ORF type:complete len:293 (+),score=105.47 TRINITY_DN2460_c0_g1_i11:73-951(+)